MKHSLPFNVILLALIATLTGCVATDLKITNLTGGSIQFYSGHTKKAFFVPAGGTVTVPHTDGKAIIISQQDEVWTYAAVNIDDFASETVKGFHRLTLPLKIHPDGTISLPSGRKIKPSYRSNN